MRPSAIPPPPSGVDEPVNPYTGVTDSGWLRAAREALAGAVDELNQAIDTEARDLTVPGARHRLTGMRTAKVALLRRLHWATAHLATVDDLPAPVDARGAPV